MSSGSSRSGAAAGSSAAPGASPAVASLARVRSNASLASQRAAAAAGGAAPADSSAASTGARTPGASAAASGASSPVLGAAPLALRGSKTAAAALDASSSQGQSAVWRTSAAKRAEKAWALQSEKTLQADPKFKKHTAAVDRALASFEGVTDWADLIACLGRLHKTLQTAPHFLCIPSKHAVARCLSQCLSPALSSGVHERALEVYAYIFEIIGLDGVRRDLNVWLPGLLPFFQLASANVKPSVLDLLEKHILPLGEELRPVTRALLLSLLPAVEEEAVGASARVLRVLDGLQSSVGQTFIMQNVWMLLMSAPDSRMAALTYLTHRLPPLDGEADDDSSDHKGTSLATAVVGRDLGLMVRGIAAALEDAALPVRRAALDFLNTQLRLSSRTMTEQMRLEDKVRLVSASLDVILRKHHGLDRRLFEWLLGPDDEPDEQRQHLETYALELVRLALRQQLFDAPRLGSVAAAAPGGAPMHQQNLQQQVQGEVNARQRPFRIFVGLLDKWEIGQPLANVLVLDALRAMRRQLEVPLDTGAEAASVEISSTARMLFEVVDPLATYRQFFHALRDELQVGAEVASDDVSAIALLRFTLRKFRMHDEESRQIHLPVILSVITELVTGILQNEPHPSPERVHQLSEGLALASDVLNLVPAHVFVRNGEGLANASTSADWSFVEHAATFYDAGEAFADEAAQRNVTFQRPDVLVQLVQRCTGLVARVLERTTSSALLLGALRLATHLLVAIDAAEDPRVVSLSAASASADTSKLEWAPDTWSEKLLARCQDAVLFDEVDHLVCGLVAAAKCRAIAAPLRLGTREIMSKLVSKLLSFMRARHSPFHPRAVELFWMVQQAARGYHAESILCERLASTDEEIRASTLEAFGTLWKLTDDADISMEVLSNPLRRVLDGLRSANWTQKQAAESWLRAYMRSYIPLVDTLLPLIIEAEPIRAETQAVACGATISRLAYQQAFDHETINYAVASLLALASFGAQAFAKALRASPLSKSHSRSVQRFFRKAAMGAEASYLDALIELVLALLRSDVSNEAGAAAAARNGVTHITTVELLQLLAVRGFLNAKRLGEFETCLLESLLFSIETGTVERQCKLLHALHTVINSRASEGQSRQDGTADGSKSAGKATHPQPHPLLLRAVRAALSSRRNKPALQHWTDFLLTATSLYSGSVADVLLPINECVCALLRSAVDDIHSAYIVRTASDSADSSCETTEVDITLLLNVGERVLLQALDATAHTNVRGSEHGGGLSQQAHEEGKDTGASTGLLGYVSNVFSSEPVPSAASLTAIQVANSVLRSLHRTVRTLHHLWTQLSGKQPSDVRGAALDRFAPKIRTRSRRSLERLFRSHSGEVVEALVDCWNAAGGSRQSTAASEATFEILAILAPSPQMVVSFMCDVISTRTAASSASLDKEKKAASSSAVSENVLFLFLDSYLSRLDAAAAVQVWPVVAVLTKDLVVNNVSHKAQLFPMLRCLTTAGELISTTSAFDDRRLRRDLTENFVRLVDLCILASGRRSARDTEPEAPAAEAAPDSEARAGTSTTAHADELLQSAQINEFLATRALPALPKFSIEADKIVSVCSNAVYYIVAPAIKAASRTLNFDAATLLLLTEMTTLPGTIKTWRTPVSDTFNDARFFQMSPEMSLRWQQPVFALFGSDPERLVELVGKISAASSVGIFTNREAEMLARATNMRRLSFVILCSSQDYFLAQLPAIQDKIVSVLRAGPADVVAAEVYLCMRVLLCRFSAQHLSGFWPVLLSEMTRLFEGMLDELPPDGSDALHLVFSACKFLDLLLTLQTDDFQIHEWLFITDTIDVVYPPDDFVSESLLDGIAASLEKRLSSRSSPRVESTGTFTPARSGAPAAADLSDKPAGLALRRPMLASMTSIARIEELHTFFARLSLASFEALYAGGKVDHGAIETGLRVALFDHAGAA